MPTIKAITPAIKKTNLKKPAVFEEDPEFEVSINVNHHTTVRAPSQDAATDVAWEEVMNQGAWELDINELEVPDGAS